MKTILAIFTLLTLCISPVCAKEKSPTGWLSSSGERLAKQAKETKKVGAAIKKAEAAAKSVKILKSLPAVPTTPGRFTSYTHRIPLRNVTPSVVPKINFEQILLWIAGGLFAAFALFVGTVVCVFRALTKPRKSPLGINRHSPVFRG